MKTIEKNEVIYFQDDLAHSIYFIKVGRIRISKFNKKGKEFILNILYPGEIFGEASVMGKDKRKEAAIAEDKVSLCIMKENKMKELLLQVPMLNFKFSQILEERLEKTQKRLEDLIFKSNQQRIIEFLKDSVNTSENSNGIFRIKNSLTHDKIAKLTSTNRQEVSSVFSYLKKHNIIDYDRTYISILDFKKLETS
ncbi:Crp/Fnr family transcriptional regulator [Gillisia hiemivivida]|jgi:CRP-like cAMP-binding protein|nr:Crp/Fnr family transcriptional regulator [Gillisia hiemivivida]